MEDKPTNDSAVASYIKRKIPFAFRGGTTTFEGSFMQSRGFLKGSRGWRVDQFGNVEINNGTFRGTFQIGGFQKTIGTDNSVQDALDEVSELGGGTVFLKSGTYTLGADIVMPPNVSLIGADRDSVIIDGAGSFGISITGTLVYNTGTVTVAVGSTTVSGSGTTFTAAMVGSQIFLGSNGYFYWYTIAGFTNATTITIDTDYFGPALSGASYRISDIVVHTTLSKITVTNCVTGVTATDAQEIQLDDIVVYDCTTGISMTRAVYPRLLVTSVENGANLVFSSVSGFKIDFSDFSNATVGDNIAFTTCGDSTFFDSLSNAAVSDGIQLTGCDGIAFISVTLNSNGGAGIHIVSGTNTNQFIGCGIENNGSDGIEINGTSDANIFQSCNITGNGGFGVDIDAADCDNNLIGMNQFASNTSGAVSDAGTGTLIRSNIGVADN